MNPRVETSYSTFIALNTSFLGEVHDRASRTTQKRSWHWGYPGLPQKIAGTLTTDDASVLGSDARRSKKRRRHVRSIHVSGQLYEISCMIMHIPSAPSPEAHSSDQGRSAFGW